MQFLKEGIVTIGLAILLWIVCRGIWLAGPGRKNGRHTTSGRELFLLLVVCYIAAVAAITIIPVPMTRAATGGLAGNNFHPLRSITETIEAVIDHPEDLLRHDTANFGGNILMFIPAGFLIPLFFARLRTLPRTALTAAAISALIELTQLMSRNFGVSRSVDVDDVVLNTAGACLGFLLYRLLSARRARNTRPARPARAL